MQKKSVVIPVAFVLVIAGVLASSGLFPDTVSLPRIPTGSGTIGGVLYSWFEADGSAKNTAALGGVSASGYLQNNNCTDPINNKWSGVDANGRGICGNGGAVLAAIGRFSEISGVVEVMKYGTSVWVPANTTDDLYPGDIIHTDSSGTGTIQFAMDDSLIRLFTDTTLELQMGNLDGNTVAEAILSDGRLWGRILSSTGVNLGGGGVVTGVRGTSVDILKVGLVYTVSITDSVNTSNKLKSTSGPISVIKNAIGGVESNTDFGKGTRFSYLSGDTNSIKRIFDDKNSFYIDPWFRKNTRLDVDYMSNLLATYSPAAASIRKTRLINELDTTVESNNTGTLFQFLQDSSIVGMSYQMLAATLLDNENQGGGESVDELNKRKSKRLNCKMAAKTYFPILDECGGSWDTFAITKFPGTVNLEGKNINWTFTDSGSVWDGGDKGKINHTGEFLAYNGTYANLAGKSIVINLSNSFTGCSASKCYILDLGDYRVYKTSTGDIKTQEKCTLGFCPGGVFDHTNPSNVIFSNLYKTITINIPPDLALRDRFYVGNISLLNFPIKNTINEVSIK